jgi:hypothetical protein
MLGLLVACDVELTGSVTDERGAPVGGAVLAAERCNAVTDDAGAFRVRCERGDHHFLVSHPTYAGAALSIGATGLFSPPPAAAVLRAWPAGAGLYLEPDYAPLPTPGLVRTREGNEQRFCIPADVALPQARPGASLFDVHDTEWRLYRLDEAGCALRLTSADGGTFWSPTASRVEIAPDLIAEGHYRVRLPEAPGRYVAAPWLDGFFVPRPDAPETWEAWALEISG